MYLSPFPSLTKNSAIALMAFNAVAQNFTAVEKKIQSRFQEFVVCDLVIYTEISLGISGSLHCHL
jgi:hypothetical protein